MVSDTRRYDAGPGGRGIALIGAIDNVTVSPARAAL